MKSDIFSPTARSHHLRQSAQLPNLNFSQRERQKHTHTYRQRHTDTQSRILRTETGSDEKMNRRSKPNIHFAGEENKDMKLPEKNKKKSKLTQITA